eukprot:3199336-Ditylum_brightwellii.AAC.1
MEKGQGFLVHIAEVYPMITPYLKDVHLTLESWQPNSDAGRWKYTRKQWLDILEEAAWDDYKRDISPDAPDEVAAVPMLYTNLMALNHLSESETPPPRLL